MKMKPTDIAKYPQFAYYMKHDFPKLIHVPQVINSLKTKGHLTSDEIAAALKWNSGPGIKIRDLSHGQCGVPSAYGCTRGSLEVEIDRQTVKDFESDSYSSKVGQNKNGKNVFIVGVTVLHELAHVGNFKHNLAEPTEAGAAFEMSTYGKSVP